MERISQDKRGALLWGLALLFYGACWILPIYDDWVGYDGAEFAHVEFWKILTRGKAIQGLNDVLLVVFLDLGWMANELFVLGLLLFLKWPAAALRCFALAFGIMVSWQAVLIYDAFPFLIGYWLWALSGGLALVMTARALAQRSQQSMTAILVRPLTLFLVFFPVANAWMAAIMAELY